MLTATQLLTFIPAALLVAASPGANNLLALRNGLRSGLRPALVALTGRFTAFALMLAVVVAGLGAVLGTSQVLFNVLKWAGALYLTGLGLHVLLTSRHRARPVPTTDGTTTDNARADNAKTDNGAASDGPRPPRRLIGQEFLTAAANPKALLLFTAFLPQFTRTDGSGIAGQLAVLGLLYIAVEAVAAAGWAGAGRLLGRRDVTSRALRTIDRVSGVAFVGLGAGLALSNAQPRPAR